MKFDIRFLAIVATALGCVLWSTVSAPAQQKNVAVPAEYMVLLDSYRGWKSANESVDSNYANSVHNWAIHALNEVGKTGITAVRNWLFTRGEDRIRALATVNKEDLRAVFGKQFNLRGMHIVFAQLFTGDTNVLYRSWYECAAKLKLFPEHQGSDRLVGDLVLMWVNSWDEKTFERVTYAGERMSDFGALSAHYGVERLSADDITAVGFLSRRFTANRLNPKFVSAEFLRKLVHDIFDPDEE